MMQTAFYRTRNYDQDYAIQSVGGLNYTVDTQGNIKTITDAAGGNGFDYDNLDRLTKVKNSATLADVTALTYDKTGNRLTKKVGTAAVQNYTYATTNHRLSQVGTVARTYDANGNTTKSDTTKFFTYDARNRLVDFRTGTTAATIVSQYQFNAKGERVRKYKGTTDQSRYLYNEGGQLLIQNKVVSGVTTTQEMIWLDDMPIGINQSGTLHGILTDHLNSPRAVFQLNNQVKVWRWDAVDDAFGEKLAVEDPDANAVVFKLDMRFSGQFYDTESGMAYNYFRDCYEASTGRYCESDPIGLAGGMSTYGYVGGNPLGRIDPLGLDFYNSTDQMNEMGPPKPPHVTTPREWCERRAFVESSVNVTPFLGAAIAWNEMISGEENHLQFIATTNLAASIFVNYGTRRVDARLLARRAILDRIGGYRNEQRLISNRLVENKGSRSFAKFLGRAMFLTSVGLEIPNFVENMGKCTCEK